MAFTTPLYRAYSQSAVDHFYTADLYEKNNAVANLRYADENIAGYIYADQFCGAEPLFRVYSPSAKDHFYTMSVNEKNNAVTSLGYVDENIMGYIFPV